MKKLFSMLFAFMFVFGMGGMASAVEPSNGICDPDFGSVGFGDLNLHVSDGSVGRDSDMNFIPNGFAFGTSHGNGNAVANAEGNIGYFLFGDGNIWGDINVTAGGLAGSNAFRDFDWGYIGVGSVSEAVGVTDGYTNIGQEFLGIGGAVMGSDMHGNAFQETTDFSYIGDSPLFFRTNGVSLGTASQNSYGWFDGDAFTGSALAGYGENEMGVGIEMNGGTLSFSYRGFEYDNGAQIEYMGNEIGSYTTVETYGFNDNNDGCIGASYGDIDGGWTAHGNTGSMTIQDNSNGFSRAYANGSYFGSGSLGSNFNGSAVGYTGTSITTIREMNGSINSASSGMNVSISSGGIGLQ